MKVMKMAFRFFLAAAVLSFLTSCGKVLDDIPEGYRKVVIRAGIEMKTKTALSGTVVYWVKGDRIAVFYDGGSTTSTVGEAGSVVDFPVILPEQVDECYGAYPQDAVTYSDGTFSMVIPDVQDGPFSKGNMSVARLRTEGVSTFRNVPAFLKIVVEDPGYSRIVLSAQGGESIAGTLSVTLSGDSPVIGEVTDGKSSISVNVVGPATYYVTVVPGVRLTKGLTASFYKNGTAPETYSVDKELVLSGSSVVSLNDLLKPSSKKKLSIFGDSISTFEGCVPAGNAVYSRYKIDGSLEFWTNTYWGLLVTKYFDGELSFEKNISWSGSCVAQDTRTGGEYRPAFVTRYGRSNYPSGHTYESNTLGSPDIVIIYGGTNDWQQEDKGNGITGTKRVPSDSEFSTIFAKSDRDLSETSFVEAYVKVVNMIHSDHPSAKILNIIGDALNVEQVAIIKKISDHYPFCRYIDFSDNGNYHNDIYNPDIPKCYSMHPNIKGMDYMAGEISRQYRDWIFQN